MEEIYEAELPGVGKKYTLKLGEDRTLDIVVHEDGRREIYYEEAGKEPVIISLSDELARKVGLILAGAYFKPAPMEVLSSALAGRVKIEWIRVRTGAGRTIGELDIRRRTGASVIAIVRGEDTIPNPNAATEIKAGDVLIAAGKLEEIQKLKELVG
ncbi:cation:proton antiporter regulatory subunit [Candidatus Pyrohabitans sp.]